MLTHLAQIELALGTRARMALVTPGYKAQKFDQDAWIMLDARLPGRAAVDAFIATARMNLAFFDGLSSASPRRRSRIRIRQADRRWIIHQMAGDQINHLKQLQRVP